MKAALVVFCGCLQMIRVTRTSVRRMIATQSKLHHSRACRESIVPDMTRLRMTAKKTEDNLNPKIINNGNVCICCIIFKDDVKKITHS